MNGRNAKRARDQLFEAECNLWVARRLGDVRTAFEVKARELGVNGVDRDVFHAALSSYAGALHSWVRNGAPGGDPSFYLGCRGIAKKMKRDLRGVKRRRHAMRKRQVLVNLSPGNRGGRRLDPKRKSPGIADKNCWGDVLKLPPLSAPPRRGRQQLSDERMTALIPAGSWKPAAAAPRAETPPTAEQLRHAEQLAAEFGWEKVPERYRSALAARAGPVDTA